MEVPLVKNGRMLRYSQHFDLDPQRRTDGEFMTVASKRT